MEFIREKIKEKPINKKRIAKQMGIAALCGGVFALTTCIVVLIFMPVLRSTFLDGMPGNQQGITPGGAQSGDSNIEENTEDTSQPGGIIPDFNLSLEDYQELQNQLYKIGSTVNKSIVTIRAIVEKEEDINQSDVDTDLGSGVIIDSDENYYYVLTEKKFVQDAPRLRVGFMNQSSADATLLKYDGLYVKALL